MFMWKLNAGSSEVKDQLKDNSKPVFEIQAKSVNFNGVANKPDSKSICYAVGTDKILREIENGKEKVKYEAGINIS